MTTIVVPLDGSDQAEQAIPWATALCQRIDAGLLLVSVVEIPVEFGAWSAASAMAVGHELDDWAAERDRYLEDVAGRLTGVRVTTHSRVGSPTSEVLSAIAAVDDPVVVMTSHGRTGAGRMVMGSVANRIVRDAQCPVLVIRSQSQASAASPSFDRVLVPLDGSTFAEHALDVGLQAIAPAGQPLTLHLLRVVESPVVRVPGPDVPLDYGLVAEYTDAMKDEATTYLASMTEKLRASAATVTSEVRHGRISDEIIAAAAEQRSDLIVMSTHGRGGISRLFFGSVAEKVLHESPLPLLLIRPRE